MALSGALPGCFYDSRWGEPKRLQEAAAKRATPSALHATTESEIPAEAVPARPVRVVRLRARATPRYAAQVVDWPKQLEHLVADANDLLAPTLGLRLEIAGAESWSPRAGEEDLEAALNDLIAGDPGEGADWVLGLVASTPRAEESFHLLGIGRAGKHLVTRAMNDAREYEAIEQNLGQLGEEERRRLYRVRKRHKTTAVFLHELGHTLGVIHEVAETTIMHPRYDHRMESYSPAAAAFMRLVLDHRRDPAAQPEAAFDEALLAEVQQTAPGWVPAERDALVARLQAKLAPPPAAPVAAAPTRRSRGDHTPPPPPVVHVVTAEDLAALRPEDRAAFLGADQDRREGRAADAWKKAEALFTAYPDVYPVQDLRCQLAMIRGGSIDQVTAQCARLMDLSQPPAAAKKR